MIKLLNKPAEANEIKAMAREIGGFYIKVVVDIEKGILAAGAKMHTDEEQLLLENGSKKEYLWGGGYDLETKQITFDSIINNKPGVNSSSDIMDPLIRDKFTNIIKELLNL
ncbi:MAG: DUF5674 family protein [Desulfobacteraceae bacterium]|jgi:hypothetical protein